MRDLVVTAHTPAAATGRGLRTYAVVRALAAHAELDVVYPVFGAPAPDAAFASLGGVNFHAVTPRRSAARAITYLRARAEGVPAGFARGVSPEVVEAAETFAVKARRVVADGPVAAATLRDLARRRKVIYNAHNLESAFRHTLHRQWLGSPRALERFERRVLEVAAEVWMVSGVDVAAARALCPRAALRCVPNVVDVTAIAPVRPADQRTSIFVGDFTYEPNRNGLDFLINDVMPQLWEKRPDARLVVVGRGLDDVSERDMRIELRGFVSDLHAAYSDAACALVPLLQGGGSPLKFIEGLAYGLPVVATRTAAQGLEATPGKHFLLGEGAEGFAQAILSALAGKATHIAAAGRQLVERHYSLESLVEVVAP